MNRTAKPFLLSLAIILVLFIACPTKAYLLEAKVNAYDDAYDEVYSDDSSSDDSIELFEEVTVKAKRKKHEGLGVQEIDKEALEQSGASRVSEALELLPAVQVGSNSRGEQKFTLRGFDSRQVLVLVDGVPLTEPYNGLIDIGKIPLGIVERIEIIKGAGSISYGSQGLGGAINIITRKPGSGAKLVSFFEMQMLKQRKFNLAYSDSYDSFYWLIAAGYDSQSGYMLSDSFKAARNEDGGLRNNSDRSDYNLAMRLMFKINKDHLIKANLTLFRGEYGVPPDIYDLRPRYWRWPLWSNINMSLSHEGHLGKKLKIEETFFVVFNDNTLNSYDDDSYTTQNASKSFTSNYHDRTLGGRVTLSGKFFPPVIERLGFKALVSLKHEQHQSSDDDDKDDDKEEAPLDRLIVGAGAEVDVLWHRYFATTLALMNETELPGNDLGEDIAAKNLLKPTIDLKFYTPVDLVIELSAARRGRFPTLGERFSKASGSRKANPDLQAEQSWNFGLDLSYPVTNNILLRAGAFESEVSNLIVEVPIENNMQQIQNLEGLRFAGVEFDASFKFDFGLKLETGYAYLFYKRLKVDEKYLEYRPGHKAYVSVSEQPLKWLVLSTRFQFTGSQNFFNTRKNNWGELGFYYLWHARIEFLPTKFAKIWLRANNILDHNYSTRYGYPAKGRSLFVGIKLLLE